MAQDFFRIGRGLDIDGDVQIIKGTTAPGGDAGDQDAADVGSLYLNLTTGRLYTKLLAGAGTNKWSPLATQAEALDGESTFSASQITDDVVDSVQALMTKWLIRIEQDDTPENVNAFEIFATHNGSNVDFTSYAILDLGSEIQDLVVAVNLTGGDTLELNVAATPAVNATGKRILSI